MLALNSKCGNTWVGMAKDIELSMKLRQKGGMRSITSIEYINGSHTSVTDYIICRSNHSRYKRNPTTYVARLFE